MFFSHNQKKSLKLHYPPHSSLLAVPHFIPFHFYVTV